MKLRNLYYLNTNNDDYNTYFLSCPCSYLLYNSINF